MKLNQIANPNLEQNMGLKLMMTHVECIILKVKLNLEI